MNKVSSKPHVSTAQQVTVQLRGTLAFLISTLPSSIMGFVIVFSLANIVAALLFGPTMSQTVAFRTAQATNASISIPNSAETGRRDGTLNDAPGPEIATGPEGVSRPEDSPEEDDAERPPTGIIHAPAAGEDVEGSTTTEKDIATTLLQCEQSKIGLSRKLIELDTSVVAERRLRQDLVVEFQSCRDDVKLNRRTNVYINEQLLALRNSPPREDPHLPEIEAELVAARQALAVAEAKVASLTERLTSNGISLTPGYGYVEDDAYASYVKLSGLSMILEDLPPLPEEECDEAMAWLEAREGDQRALRRELWVWREKVPLLCFRGVGGEVMIAEPKQNDTAHVIVFQ